MAKLTKKEVLHIASLAKLNLTESEVKKFTPQLSKIVDFVSQLSEVDVDDVEPTSQTTGLENIYRDDVVNSGDYLENEGPFEVDAILTERSDK